MIVFTHEGEIALKRSYEIIAGMEEDYAAIAGRERLSDARATLTQLLAAVEDTQQTS